MRTISKALLLASFILVLALSYNAVSWSDDFVFFQRFQSSANLLDYFLTGYKTWDGRFVSLQAVAQILIIRFLPASLGVFIWSLCLVWLSAIYFYLFFQTAVNHNTGRIKNRNYYIMLIFICLWLGFSFHISDTVYWVTGGIYVFSLALVFNWIYIYNNLSGKLSPRKIALFYLFTFIVGFSGVNATIPLLIILLIDWLVNNLHITKDTLRNQLIPILLLIIGTLVVALAPGNFVRASNHQSSFTFDPYYLAFKSFEISARYIYYSLPAILIAVLLSIVLPFKSQENNGKNYITTATTPIVNYKATIIRLIYDYKYLIAAVSSILPILAVPEFSGRRTSVYFMAFIFLWLVQLIRCKLNRSQNQVRYSISFSANNNIGNIIISSLGVIVIIMSLQHFKIGYEIKSQIETRERYLSEMKDLTDTINVKPIIVEKIPFSYKFHDRLHNAYAKKHGYNLILLDTNDVHVLPYYYITPP